ncbi:MAG: efflux RND transporter permease subunit [Bacteroidales bacterium]|nr:efflux RND transporter permease subunit [Bacteroidales bacterium]
MEIKERQVIREFKLSSWALRNKNTVFLMIVILLGFGFYSYRSLPKELFPDLVWPTIFVQTMYPGNPPLDIENLVTRPLEKEIESAKGVKEIRSTSTQDVSAIFIEFNTDVSIEDALQEVKDAVDKAKSEMPDDLPSDPVVLDLDLSEFPIMNINLSGDYSINELKSYAEMLEDEIERVSEISKVEIIGVNEREVKINVDMHKLSTFELSFDDIENAIAFENISMSGGEIKLGESRRSIRIIGEFTDPRQIEDIIVKWDDYDIVYMHDVADVIFGFEESRSFSRLDKQAVVSLQVIKKSGENLLNATDQVFDIVDKAIATKILPSGLSIEYTNDQSEMVRDQLSNLENSMVMGVIFVILVLFFFLGTRNSLFVGFAIPMSMFLSFMVLGLMGSKINMIVLFSLILALGMLVDNAIVVVENIYRFVDRGYSKTEAAKQAVGEIAMPIIASTATTLAAFFPLLFWDSVMGEFMKYLPMTLIIVLTSSLFVALVIIPVVSSTFIKSGEQNPKPDKKRSLVIAGVLTLMAVIFYLVGINPLGTLCAAFALIGILNIYVLNSAACWFQQVFLVKLENAYLNLIRFALRKKNSFWLIGGTFMLLLLTMNLYFSSNPNIVNFPSSDPKYINILAELPIGTDIIATNEFMKTLENDVFSLLEPNKEVVKSVLTTVGAGARLEDDINDISEKMFRGLITISFIDYEERGGINTGDILAGLSNQLLGRYPGVELTIEKQNEGPPAGKPINLEIIGKDFDKLLLLSDSVLAYLNMARIEGIEGLKLDLDLGKPEIIVHIDRDKARRFGLSTGQIASTIRTALFGKEVSTYKEGEDEYPIQLRLMDKYRYNIPALLNQMVTFRSSSTGKIVQVPISAVADFSYNTTYGSVKRKDLDRVITIYSNVVEGYNATKINDQLKAQMSHFDMPPDYSYKFTGEQEEQEESMAFLINALLIAISLITVILVSQFNSIVKPGIIMLSVLFSTTGVFGGLWATGMDFVVIMTGIGIVSLAGVVVNNAIVLIDYIDLLKTRRKKELGLNANALLRIGDTVDCIVEAGKTRLRPVLLTAITTILGLLPLAMGINIDFESFLTTFDAKIYFGGDNVAFWGPISWTIIYGLTFATFLTLVIVPSLYYVLYLGKIRIVPARKKK